MSDCLFCKIVDGQIPAEVIYQDDQVVAFKDINPAAPFHALVIPKKHISTLNDAESADAMVLGQLQLTAAKIAADHGFAEDGYRTVMNCRDNGGQTVYHIHLHLLGGKAMGWPPYQDTLKTL